MAEAARKEHWQHTAWLAAMIANANRDPRRKPSPYTPDDFNPMVFGKKRGSRSGDVVVTKENIGELREMFTAFHRSRK
jgi:hypothetical protein